jgi:hypothetical protein
MDSQSDAIARGVAGIAKADYGEGYHEHLLKQYLKYVEMADKVSERRSAANTFFLTVNTGIISAIGLANWLSQKLPPVIFGFVGVAALLLCFSWYRLIRSYRDLNTAKFKVVHELETYLPVRPYDAEWESVGRGQDKKLYLPFTHIERFIPWIFMALYAGLILYVLWEPLIQPICQRILRL